MKLVAALLALVLVVPAFAFQEHVAVESLPPEARQTLGLIKGNGPFPYPQDGKTFRNREKRLPVRAQGYYREYTVRTPRATCRMRLPS